MPLVPFVDEVETFNSHIWHKPNNYEPLQFQIKRNGNSSTILSSKNLKSIEKLAKTGRHCGNFGRFVRHYLCFPWETVTMLHGLKDKIWPAYQEVQASKYVESLVATEEGSHTNRQQKK